MKNDQKLEQFYIKSMHLNAIFMRFAVFLWSDIVEISQ